LISFFLSTVDECRQLFARVITTDAACRGFDPVSDGTVLFTSHSYLHAFCFHCLGCVLLIMHLLLTLVGLVVA